MRLSPNSVNRYLRSAYRKISVVRRSFAVSWAMRHGSVANYVRLDPEDVA